MTVAELISDLSDFPAGMRVEIKGNEEPVLHEVSGAEDENGAGFLILE